MKKGINSAWVETEATIYILNMLELLVLHLVTKSLSL